MRIIAKKPILEEIDSEVRAFLAMSDRVVDYVSLSNDEWAEAAKALHLTAHDTEFKHKGVLCVRETFMPSTYKYPEVTYKEDKKWEQY